MYGRKRVLVTGGAGFLGSFLCERLLSSGCEVICADNYFTGSRDNIAHLLDNPYFEVIRLASISLKEHSRVVAGAGKIASA
jgi:UDP-glucuronate decarboxylase